jgi:hypothetical protein
MWRVVTITATTPYNTRLTAGQNLCSLIGAAPPCYCHDVTHRYGGALGKNEANNSTMLDKHMASLSIILPTGFNPVGALRVYIYHWPMGTPAARVRDCGFAAPGLRVFMLSDLTPAAPPPPPPLLPEPAGPLPVFRLPMSRGAAALMGSGRTPKVERLLEVARAIVAMLPMGPEEDAIPLPDGTADLLEATVAEWDDALMVLTASTCRMPKITSRLADGYATLVRACAAADPTFMRRMVQHNPYYAGCRTPEIAAAQAAQTVTQNAEQFRFRYFSLRASIRCFVMLIADDNVV